MSGTTPAVPDFILKFEGELTPEQLAMFRALWEAAVNVSEPEGFRVWKAGVAHGRAAKPGLLCACWFRSRARANRKARIQAAAMKVHDELTRKDTR